MSNRISWLVIPVVLVSLAAGVPVRSADAADGGAPPAVGYVPAITIALEVRTPQGDLRSLHRPGAPPTYWPQNMPVVQGDKLTITPMVTTGGAEMARLVLRLDSEKLADRPSTSSGQAWRVEVDTASIVPGYHMVEVWAATKPPNAGENSATTTFLVVPKNDPLLAALQQGAGAAGPPVSDEERLACTIRSRDPGVDAGLVATSQAKVTQPTLFFVAAGPAAKEYFYSLSREGRVTYVSPRLPLTTNILLEPQAGEGQGQAPGELILTVRAGDDEGRFGAPAWLTLQIEGPKVHPPEAGKSQ